MPAGKSGGSQNQNGYQSGQQSGSGYQVGVSGNQSDSSGTSASTVDPTAAWLTGSNQLFGSMGSGGLTPQQKYATDLAYGSAQNSPVVGGLSYYSNQLRDTIGKNPAQQINSPTVSAQSGASNMGAYQNPWDQQVVDASLGDVTRKYDEAMNQNRLNQAAGGAFGGSRNGIQNAKTTDDYLRTIAATSGGLRSQGFNTAAGYGQQDANRSLSADATNASNSIAAQNANASNALTSRNQDLASYAQQGNYFGQIQDAGQQDRQQLYNMSGGGLQQLVGALGTQTPAFGQTNTNTSTGTNYGVTGNAMDYAGQSSGTNQSSGSSKGGGIGIV